MYDKCFFIVVRDGALFAWMKVLQFKVFKLDYKSV